MSGIVWIIYIALAVIFIAAFWKIFTKAGEEGWKAIIPIWNTLVLLKIIGREWWWILLLAHPDREHRDLGDRLPSTWRRASGAEPGFAIGQIIFLPFHLPGSSWDSGATRTRAHAAARATSDPAR